MAGGRLEDRLRTGYDGLDADAHQLAWGRRCRRRARDLRAGVDDTNNCVHFPNVVCLEPVFKRRVEGFRRRLLNDDRLRRRKLDLDDGGLGDPKLWRGNKGERVAAFWLRWR